MGSALASPNATQDAPGATNVALAVLSLLTSLGLVAFGIWRMTTYDSGVLSDDKIVGGGAYNYTILATRGVGFICAGVAFAGIGAVFALLAVRKVLLERRP